MIWAEGSIVPRNQLLVSLINTNPGLPSLFVPSSPSSSHFVVFIFSEKGNLSGVEDDLAQLHAWMWKSNGSIRYSSLPPLCNRAQAPLET